jgi:hypothetical protein
VMLPNAASRDDITEDRGLEGFVDLRELEA